MSDDNPLDWGETMHIYTDGASRGNPGHAACAYVFADDDDEVFDSNHKYLGETTNNRAEYEGVILALNDAVGVHRGPYVLHSDSQLVVKQLNKEWRVKSDNLLPLYDEAIRLMQRYDELDVCYVPRENELIDRADELCNQSLNGKLGKT